MKISKQAFTLIELLVVVLIVAILAAVALPQYQIAVAKSRFATMKHLADAVVKAEEVYYLANGKYTSNFAQLDIQMPTNKLAESTTSTYVYEWGYCQIPMTGGTARISCQINKPLLGYTVYFPHSNYPSFRICQLPDTNDTTDWRNKICQAEGPSMSRHKIDDHLNWYYPTN